MLNFPTLEEELAEENLRSEYKSSSSVHENTPVIQNSNKAAYSEKRIEIKENISFLCIKCYKNFKDKRNAKRHIKFIHESEYFKEKVDSFLYKGIKGMSFACNLCNLASNLQSAVTKHMKTVHKGNFEYLNLFIRSNNEKLQNIYKMSKIKLFMQNLKRRNLNMKGRKENLKRKKMKNLIERNML